MNAVERFLKLNGFTKKLTAFENDKCSVYIDEYSYEVTTRDGSIVSDNLSIYWLIGVLTYYGLIDKNYKQ